MAISIMTKPRLNSLIFPLHVFPYDRFSCPWSLHTAEEYPLFALCCRKKKCTIQRQQVNTPHPPFLEMEFRKVIFFEIASPTIPLAYLILFHSSFSFRLFPKTVVNKLTAALLYPPSPYNYPLALKTTIYYLSLIVTSLNNRFLVERY